MTKRPEDIDDEDRELLRHIEETKTLIFPLIDKIKRTFRGTTRRGTVTCPKCSGRMEVTHARHNGHVSLRCRTEGCVSIME